MPQERNKIAPYKSPDVQDKYASMGRPSGQTTGIALHVPVKVMVDVSDPVLIEALMRSSSWRDRLKPQIDIGKFILRECDGGFLEEFYDRIDELEVEEFCKLVKKHVVEK